MERLNILFTNRLTQEHESLLRDAPEIQWKNISLIDFKYKKADQWLKKVPKKSAYWVLTSVNGVNAIHSSIDLLPEPLGVFCVGPKTAQSLPPVSCEVSIPHEYNAEALIEHIQTSEAQPVLIFKGNLSDNRLEEGLKSLHIPTRSIVVYKTTKKSIAIDPDEYNALSFLSPSAIDAFLSSNTLQPDLPVFCIGKTTAAKAEDCGFTNILIAEDSTFESLLQTIKNYTP